MKSANRETKDKETQGKERGDRRTRESPKRRAILQAARASLLMRGYGGTSMEGVAQAAHVSKVTVYAHFPTKAELFRTVIEEHCRSQMGIGAHLEWLPEEPAQALTLFARRWCEMLLWPDVIAVSRIVAAEVSRFPELGTSFLAAAAAPLEEALVEYLEQANATGRLRIPDPALTAHLFLDTLRGGFFYRRLMGQETAPEELARSIDELVAMVVARGNA